MKNWKDYTYGTPPEGLTKTSRDDAGTPSLGPVSHQVDGLGAITVSDAGTP